MNEHLSAYLNDHLAAANSAIDLLQLLRDQYPGKPIAAFALEMMSQVREDRTFLQNILDRMGNGPSAIKQAAGWLGSKVSELKFTPDPYGTFRALETLSLGVEGKLLLWQTLASLAGANSALQNLAFDNLMARGKKQRVDIEQQRMLMAEAAFTAPVPVPAP